MSTPENRSSWESRLNPLVPYARFREPEILLYLHDCLTGLRRYVPKDSISVVVTSPPYNMGIKYNGYNDLIDRNDYFQWIGKVAAELYRVLEPTGSIFFNVGGRPSDPFFSWKVAEQFKQFVLLNVIHWIKSIAIRKDDVGRYPNIKGDIAVGHYKPLTSKRFLHSAHEYIFHFTKTRNTTLDPMALAVPYQDKSNVGRWKRATEDKRSPGNVWFIPYKTITDRTSQRPHPATFPVKLPEMCIRLHGLFKTQVALDPFMGIGSTALACSCLGIPCIGFETDSTYLDVAKDRLQKAVLGQSKLI